MQKLLFQIIRYISRELLDRGLEYCRAVGRPHWNFAKNISNVTLRIEFYEHGSTTKKVNVKGIRASG